ncbi:unnamed protein product [Boreogadus saida]
MTQPMQSLQLTQSRRVPGGPASPSAAKRLYRNLSEKLRGSTSSFEDTYFFGKSDRLRKASTMQGSDCILEAVEQQDLDTVQILLYQYTADELDLNTPNSQGLTSLDIAIMTNNTPIAKLLLKAGGKESPHFEPWLASNLDDGTLTPTLTPLTAHPTPPPPPFFHQSCSLLLSPAPVRVPRQVTHSFTAALGWRPKEGRKLHLQAANGAAPSSGSSGQTSGLRLG